MNERINELFDKALDEVIPNTWTNLTMDQLNDIKNYFAELIVKECGVALKPSVQVRDVISRGQAYDLIKKHFGIEERKGWVCPKCGVDRTREACPRGHTAAITGDCPMTATAQSGVEL